MAPLVSRLERSDISWVNTTRITVATDATEHDDGDPEAEATPEGDEKPPNDSSINTIQDQGLDEVEDDESVSSDASVTSDEQDDATNEFIVHSELLEGSSDFFRSRANFQPNTLHQSKAEPVVIPAHQKSPLVRYLQWLYDPNFAIGHRDYRGWDILLECFIFADEYQADDFRQYVIQCIFEKLRASIWQPTPEQIKFIYDHTTETSGLRKLVTNCVFENSIENVRTLLKFSPSEFVLDYAIVATTQLSIPGDGKKLGTAPTTLEEAKDYFESPSTITKPHWSSSLLSPIWQFENIISFVLVDSKAPAAIHADAFKWHDELNPTRDSLLNVNQQYHLPDTTLATFQIFASWLYFTEDMTSHDHIGQRVPGHETLLLCYSLAKSLQEINASSTEPEDPVQNALIAYQGSKFHDAILHAIAAKKKNEDYSLSLDEVEVIYVMTAKDIESPLRKLFVTLAVESSQSMDIEHPAFQRDLTKALIASNKRLRAELDLAISLTDAKPKLPSKVASGSIYVDVFLQSGLGASDSALIVGGSLFNRPSRDQYLKDHSEKLNQQLEVCESITAQLAYVNYSFEELRLWFYEMVSELSTHAFTPASSSHLYELDIPKCYESFTYRAKLYQAYSESKNQSDLVNDPDDIPETSQQDSIERD